MNAFQTVIMTLLLLTNRTPTQLPSAAELLDKYDDTQDKLRSSFISKLEIDGSFKAFDKARPNIKPGRMYQKHFKMELRFDGKKSYEYLKMWGDRPGTSSVSEAEAQHSYDLWDGQIRYQYIAHPYKANDPGKLTLYYERFSHWQHAQGRALRGYFPGASERIDNELQRASTLSVESRKDGTDGSQLYLVSGSTGGSEFQIWFDPEHGHNIAKAIVKRSWAGWNRPEGRSDRSPKGHATVWLDDVSFKQIDDLWVPVAASYRRDHEYVTGEYEKAQHRIIVTEFVVNPDHEALESFSISFIQNCAEVRGYVDRNNGLQMPWDPKYCWQTGAEIVADHNGRLVSYEPQKKMLPVVKRIPELRYLHLKSIEGKIKDKSILLCFCNMTQPASQHFLKVLKEQVLNSGDIVVGIVDCPGGIAARGRSRAGLDRSSFAIGVIDRYADKLLRAWAVERLPHLVLTDTNHIVIAEGFRLDELDEKIEEIKPSSRVPGDKNKVTGLVKDSQGRALSGMRVTEYQTDRDYITDSNGRFVSAFGPSDEQRFFYSVDSQRKLVGVGRLSPGEEYVEIELAPSKIVSGMVVDTTGKPVAGTQVAPLPMTCFHVITDKQGEFDLGWSPEWAGDLKEFFLMARHLGRNLAGGIEIGENARTVKIELEPALTLTGMVEEPNGVPIPGAEVGLSLRRGWACGTPVRKVITDEKGRYTFPVLLQRQEYINYAKAEGFWPNQITTGIINRITDREQVGPIILKRPNLYVSGVVLNANGELVADIPVHLEGEGQPKLDSKTDAKGEFLFENVCSGLVQISAKNKVLFGKIETEGGAKNVKLVVRPRFE